jgi:glycosyltransferase involved in cell wall biosynthesis
MAATGSFQPIVSIVIPAYNAAHDIAVALRSVLGQTFTNSETIVVNDGSPDTLELERGLAPFSTQIRYIRQSNAGAAAARNTGIISSRGRYIAFLDADDLWDSVFLASQIRYLEQRPSCALVYADARISGESPLAGRTFMETTPSEGDVTLESLLSQRCTVLTSTVVVRREALRTAGLFNPSIRRGHDFDLWVRIAHCGFRIEYQRVVLAERRVRADGLSGDPVKELERAVAVYGHVARTLSLTPAQRDVLRRRAAWIADRRELECARLHLTRGNVVAARRHLQAIRHPTGKVLALRAALLAMPGVTRRMCLASGRLGAAAAASPRLAGAR